MPSSSSSSRVAAVWRFSAPHIALVIVQLTFSSYYVVGKYCMDYLNPIVFVTLRMLIATVLLWPFIIFVTPLNKPNNNNNNNNNNTNTIDTEEEAEASKATIAPSSSSSSSPPPQSPLPVSEFQENPASITDDREKLLISGGASTESTDDHANNNAAAAAAAAEQRQRQQQPQQSKREKLRQYFSREHLRRAFLPQHRRDALFRFITCCFSILSHSLIAIGLLFAPSSNAAIFQPAIPVCTTLVSVLLKKEEKSVLKFFGIAVTVSGAIFMVAMDLIANPNKGIGSGGSSAFLSRTSIGNALFIAYTIVFSIFLVLQKSCFEMGVHSVTFTWYTTAFGTVVAFAISLVAFPRSWLPLLPFIPADQQQLPVMAWLAILYVGTIATAFAFGINAWAASKTTPSIVSMYIPMQPVMTSVLAFVALHEALPWYRMAGGAIIAIGVFIVIYSKARSTATKIKQSKEKDQQRQEQQQPEGAASSSPSSAAASPSDSQSAATAPAAEEAEAEAEATTTTTTKDEYMKIKHVS